MVIQTGVLNDRPIIEDSSNTGVALSNSVVAANAAATALVKTYRVEEYGGVGYLADPGSGNRTFSDQAFTNMLVDIKASNRAGVIEIPNKTFYIENEILIQDVTAVEIRGYGGHRQDYRHFSGVWTENVGAIATIHQTDISEHCIRLFSTSGVPTSITTFLMRDMKLLGEQVIVNHVSGGDGIHIDDSERWMSPIELNNCHIHLFYHGIGTNLRHEPASLGCGNFNVDKCTITSCLWGIFLDGGNGINGTTRIRDSSIRANGAYFTPEADYTTITSGGGVRVRKASSLTITDCNLESNTNGLKLDYVWGGHLDANYFEGHVTSAINLHNCSGVTARAQYSSTQTGFWGVPNHAEDIYIKDCGHVDFFCSVSRGPLLISGASVQTYTAGPTIVDGGGNTGIIIGPLTIL